MGVKRSVSSLLGAAAVAAAAVAAAVAAATAARKAKEWGLTARQRQAILYSYSQSGSGARLAATLRCAFLVVSNRKSTEAGV